MSMIVVVLIIKMEQEREVDVCVLLQAEDGIRDLVRSRGLGDVYKRQASSCSIIRSVSEFYRSSQRSQRSIR